MLQENSIQIFNNENLKMKVRAIKNEDGSISVSAEDTAIGYGWCQNKNDKVYVRWETLNGFLNELGISQEVGKDDYVPESVFYLLGMKAKNKIALDFQKWLATEVIPSIRKNGQYLTTKSEEPKLLAVDVVDKLDKTIDKLGTYYKPTHKKKLEINSYIKNLLIKNDRDNCDKVKELLLLQLGYDIYDDVPIDILHSTDTANKIFEICKIINYGDGTEQTSLF
ncbi:MAG: BRO-N domain-containing protein [Peptostreptococcaceae bacterium]